LEVTKRASSASTEGSIRVMEVTSGEEENAAALDVGLRLSISVTLVEAQLTPKKKDARRWEKFKSDKLPRVVDYKKG